MCAVIPCRFYSILKLQLSLRVYQNLLNFFSHNQLEPHSKIHEDDHKKNKISKGLAALM